MNNTPYYARPLMLLIEAIVSIFRSVSKWLLKR